jgi:hypothetical protein
MNNAGDKWGVQCNMEKSGHECSSAPVSANYSDNKYDWDAYMNKKSAYNGKCRLK